MNVTLVQPPVFWTTTPPLGPAYLAGELRRAGETPSMLDFNIELFAGDPPAYAHVRRLTEQVGHDSPLRSLPLDDMFVTLARAFPVEWHALAGLVDTWVARILATRPDLVGLSIHEESLLPALGIADRLRRLVGADARPRIVAGGPEAVFLQKDSRAIATRVLDAVVVGEGEGPLRQIVHRVNSAGIDLDRSGFGETLLPGAVICTHSGQVLDGAACAPLVDIHEIALPSFDGLPLALYSFARTLPIIGSRGCPAKCTFCFETVMWARFRLRTVASVVAEIQQRLADYGPPLSFRFNDSLLNGDLDWLARLGAQLLEDGIQIKWHGNARIHPRMDRQYLDRLAQAGLTGLLYGVESGSDKILRRMKKGVRAADIPRALHDTNEAGLWTHGFFILGFPGENDAEALQTVDLILDRLEDLDSLVFHDFALPSELAEYVDFAGRVAMDDPSAIVSGRLYLQSNVTAVRPWLQAFLACFLEFAHAYGYLHWHSIAAPETRAVLALYRRRWRQSKTLAIARAALLVARALLAELHVRSLTAFPEALMGSGAEQGLRLLRTDAEDPIERTLAHAVNASDAERQTVTTELAARFATGAVTPPHDEVLSVLARHLDVAGHAKRINPMPHEKLSPEGFR
jgi:hypothetical protein